MRIISVTATTSACSATPASSRRWKSTTCMQRQPQSCKSSFNCLQSARQDASQLRIGQSTGVNHVTTRTITSHGETEGSDRQRESEGLSAFAVKLPRWPETSRYYFASPAVRTLGETDVKHVVFAKAHGAVRKRQSCARIPPGCCSWREEADQFQSAGPEKKLCQRAAAQMFARY